MGESAPPIASVIMSAWNAESFLDQAIESILTQSFSNFELIIVDDGSTDRTAALLAAYRARDSRISVFSRNHQGRVSALNFACERARGKYLFNLDADDIALPHRIEQQLAFMEKNPDVALLGAARRMIWADGRSIAEKKFPTDDASIRDELTKSCCFCHSAVVVRKDAFVAVGGYRAAFKHGQDYDLFLRIAHHGKVANLDEVLVLYRVHGNQESALSFEQMILSAIAAQISARLRAQKQSEEPLFADENTISRAALRGLGVTDEEIDKKTLLTLEHYLALALSPDRPAGSQGQAEAFIARVKQFCGDCHHKTLLAGNFPLIARVLSLTTRAGAGD